jgi:N6-adenosine-specific RNA methylase IME4
MTLEEICALPVRDLAADDEILYLWMTVPLKMEEPAVMRGRLSVSLCVPRRM